MDRFTWAEDVAAGRGADAGWNVGARDLTKSKGSKGSEGSIEGSIETMLWLESWFCVVSVLGTAGGDN